MKAARSRALLLLVAFLVPAFLCAARVLVSGGAELRASALVRDDDMAAAVVHARRAASWYLPLAPHVPEAYRELRELAVLAERRGDRESALFAWRAIRSASLSTRWLIEPRRRERQEADIAIARLSAEGAPASTISQHRLSSRELQRIHGSWLARDDSPRPGWVLFLVAGLFAWAGGMHRLLTKGMTPEGRLLSEARIAGIVAALGVVVFAVGLIWA